MVEAYGNFLTSTRVFSALLPATRAECHALLCAVRDGRSWVARALTV